jgi:hypothetical protein
MGEFRRNSLMRALLGGLLVGLALSVSGLTPLLWVFGFWMSGGLLLLVLVPITLVIALRQRALREALSLAVGTVIGLCPGLWFYARRTADFWLEFGFPLMIGFAIALSVAPLYVGAMRRWTKSRSALPAV